jgi:hypothetical protein
MIQNVATIVYVVVSLTALVVLSYLYTQCKSTCPKERLCICHGAGSRYCVNRDEVQKLYTEGALTESSNLVRGPPPPDLSAEMTQFHQYPPNTGRTQCSQT